MSFFLPKNPLKEKPIMKCKDCNHIFMAGLFSSAKCPKCGSANTKKSLLDPGNTIKT